MFDDLTTEQLLVLQRSLLEAKFSSSPRDTALQGSPVLAELALSVLSAIRGRYADEGDESRVQQWVKWSRWSERSIEQGIVREHLERLEAWPRMTAADRIACTRALIAPFDAADEEIEELISFRDQG